MTKEEAIEKVREMKLSPGKDAELIIALHTLIPELAESEDERIINQLITLVNSTGEVLLIPTNKEELIAWLEKQKENPKSANSIPSDCASDAKCEDKSPKHSDSDGTDIRDTPAYRKGWDDAMKQKEQKHPNGCFACDEYKKGYEAGRLNGFTAGYNKAMKEIDQKEQKPADRFEEARGKYQVEWSEEDEMIRNAILGFLSPDKGGTKYSSCAELVKWSDWLKSLRPVSKESLQSHWKPSEEQMKALQCAVVFMEIRKASDYNITPLKSLYEQLKKLM